MNCSNVRMFGCWIAALMLAASAFATDVPHLRVNVTSQPEGASVIIDGVDRGRTPAMLFDLEPGRHHLKYRLAGYVEKDVFVDTRDARGPCVEWNESLEEEKGILLLKTDPADCDIQIDGVSVGRTPLLVTHLPVKGSTAVKLRKAGYLDQTIKVRFDGRRPLVREEKMVSASGTIDITSEPAGAEVTVNGIVRGVTPITVDEVPRGRATVKFRLDGFAEEVRELAINAGDVQTLPIVLKGLPGTLVLTSVPEGARFYVNDEAKGKGPVSVPGLKPGEYMARAELEGYGTTSRTITLGNGQSVNEEFRLSNVMGRIEVRTSPVGAQVVLDGRPCGFTRSKDLDAEFSDVLAIENVMEGEHTLVLKMDGYADRTCHPEVEREKTAKLHGLRLRRIFTPDIEIVTSLDTYRGVLVRRSAVGVEIEIKPGVMRSFSQDEIRKINFLSSDK